MVPIRCGATMKCPYPAFAQFEICGLHSDKRAPLNVCRRHSSAVATDFLSISNDVRLRRAV